MHTFMPGIFLVPYQHILSRESNLKKIMNTKYKDQMSYYVRCSYRENQQKIVSRHRCCVLRSLSKAATSPSAGSMAIARERVTRVTKGRAIYPRLGQPVAGGTGR